MRDPRQRTTPETDKADVQDCLARSRDTAALPQANRGFFAGLSAGIALGQAEAFSFL